MDVTGRWFIEVKQHWQQVVIPQFIHNKVLIHGVLSSPWGSYDVDVSTEGYEVARQYMTRLEKRDLEDRQLLEKMAAVVQLSPEQFVERFAYLTE